MEVVPTGLIFQLAVQVGILPQRTHAIVQIPGVHAEEFLKKNGDEKLWTKKTPEWAPLLQLLSGRKDVHSPNLL